MTAIPTAEMPSAVDVLVIGGGLAGLEVARHLDAAGVDSLIVEAGPGTDLQHINVAFEPSRAEEMWTDARTDEYFTRPWTSRSSPHFGDESGLRCRLGGRSLYWHGVLLPIESWALRQPWWPPAVIADLTKCWRDGPPLYEQVLSELLGWRGNVGEVSPVDIGGFELVPPPQAIRRDHAEPERWRAFSPLQHWTEGAPSGSARLVTELVSAGVLVRGGHAVGVMLTGGTVVRADRVVLAAGTVENTRLAAQAMAEVGLPPVLPGLVDHLVQGFNVTVPARGLPEGHFFWYAPADGHSRSNLFAEGVANTKGGVELEVWVTGEQVPSALGEVRCAPSATWPWPTEVRAGLSFDDLRVVEAQRAVLQRFWDGLCDEQGRSGSALGFGWNFLEPPRTLRQVRAWLRHDRRGLAKPLTWSSPLGTEEHEGGTLAFGTVLDDRHEMVAVPGLYVTGPATFPRQGAANPAMTILALARRLAGVLAQ